MNFTNSTAWCSAWEKTFKYYPPKDKSFGGEESFLLPWTARFFWFSRHFWFAQWVKFFYRALKNNAGRTPIQLVESVNLFFTIFWMVVCVVLWADDKNTPIGVFGTIAMWFCIWRTYEICSENLYYMVFLKSFESQRSYNTTRSLILVLLSTVELWLVLSLMWFFSGSVEESSTVLDSMYFTSATYFTVGYGDMAPSGVKGHSLAIFGMFCSFSMLLIVVSKTLGLITYDPEIIK